MLFHEILPFEHYKSFNSNCTDLCVIVFHSKVLISVIVVWIVMSVLTFNHLEFHQIYETCLVWVDLLLSACIWNGASSSNSIDLRDVAKVCLQSGGLIISDLFCVGDGWCLGNVADGEVTFFSAELPGIIWENTGYNKLLHFCHSVIFYLPYSLSLSLASCASLPIANDLEAEEAIDCMKGWAIFGSPALFLNHSDGHWSEVALWQS